MQLGYVIEPFGFHASKKRRACGFPAISPVPPLSAKLLLTSTMYALTLASKNVCQYVNS